MTGDPPSSPLPSEQDPHAPVTPDGMVPGSVDARRAIERSSWQRKARIGALVSIFTLALITASLEVGLRVTGDRQDAMDRGMNRTNRRWVALSQAGIFEELDDNVRRYAMRPGASCEVDGWNFRVNSHRTRGADFPREKPTNEKRLLALGDSFCFGMWAGEEETLVGHLTAMANARERELGSQTVWRAVNLGVPGYHSGQQLRAFEQDGLDLDPDVVVLYYNTNDIDREGFFFDAELGALRNDHLPLPTSLRRLLWSSHLYGFITRHHYEAFKAIPSPHLDPRVPWANVRDDNKAATKRSITRIAQLCRERGIPLFMVAQPLWTWSGDARSDNWPVLKLVDWASQVKEELELPGLDLLGLLRGYKDGRDRFGTAAGGEALFAVDAYIADEMVVAGFAEAKSLAAADGANWDALTLAVQASYLGRISVGIPELPDFHLTGEGYGHIARLAYPLMQAEGMLP